MRKDISETNKELFTKAIVEMNSIRNSFVQCANDIKTINENFSYISKYIGVTPPINDEAREFTLSDVGDDKFPITISKIYKLSNPMERLRSYINVVSTLIKYKESFVSKYQKLKERTGKLSKGKHTPEENAAIAMLRKITETIKVIDVRINLATKHFNNTRLKIFKRIMGDTEILHKHLKSSNVKDTYDNVFNNQILRVLSDIELEENNFQDSINGKGVDLI